MIYELYAEVDTIGRQSVQLMQKDDDVVRGTAFINGAAGKRGTEPAEGFVNVLG